MNQKVFFQKKHGKLFNRYISSVKFKLLENFQSQKQILPISFRAKFLSARSPTVYIDSALPFVALYN